MEIQKDPCCIEWLQNLKPQTAKPYVYGLVRFCNYTGKTPSTLINEARTDYVNRVPPWELRHIRLIEGFVASFDGGLANWTKITILKAVAEPLII